jgi:hypothetical protein
VHFCVFDSEKTVYNELAVKLRRASIGVGLATVIAVLGLVGSARLRGQTATSRILESAEMVYSGASATKIAGLQSTETYANVFMPWQKAFDQVLSDIPTALERNGSRGPYLIVPQTKNGRVLLSEFPEQAISIKPGKLARVDGKLVVLKGTGASWAHVQIQDYRQPSVLESAFNWLGDRLGI